MRLLPLLACLLLAPVVLPVVLAHGPLDSGPIAAGKTYTYVPSEPGTLKWNLDGTSTGSFDIVGSSGTSTTHQITIENAGKADKSDLNLKLGDKVIWKNNDDVSHRITGVLSHNNAAPSTSSSKASPAPATVLFVVGLLAIAGVRRR